MDSRNNKENTTVISSENLLEELDTLREAIMSISPDHPDNGELLAIVRLLSGFGSKDWAELSQKYNLVHWLAIDLKSSSAQNLCVLYEEMKDLAFQKDHDPLTALPNRRVFMRNFEIELQRQERNNADLSVVTLDLDNFKNVNDTYGHAMGDEVLKRLSAKLLSSKRAYDTAARIGGEEFAMLLPGASSTRAGAIVERILTEFREEAFTAPDGSEFNITFSAAITSVKEGKSHGVDSIISTADKALYEAKNTGKNKVVILLISNDGQVKKSMVHSNEKHFLFTGIHM